jgi:hypothetical protein
MLTKKRASRAKKIAAVAITVAVSCGSAFAESDVSISGSIRNDTGYIAMRDTIPDAATRDWYSVAAAYGMIAADSDKSRFRAKIWTSYDEVAGTWQLSLDEVWYEWNCRGLLTVRGGRIPVQFGPCVAFNPANSFVDRDCFDERTGKVGLDGMTVELRPLLAVQDCPFSLSVSGTAILPGSSGSLSKLADPDLAETSALALVKLTLPETGIFGQTELGFAGDARRIGGTESAGDDKETLDGIKPCTAGGWISADVAGFVIGVEGAVRSSGYEKAVRAGYYGATGTNADKSEGEFAASINRKEGDFFALAEARYSGSEDEWLGFGRLSWAKDDVGISASGLIDFDTYAARTALEATWNASDFLAIALKATWNYLPEKWDDPLPSDFTAGIALEYFF